MWTLDRELSDDLMDKCRSQTVQLDENSVLSTQSSMFPVTEQNRDPDDAVCRNPHDPNTWVPLYPH